MIFMSEGSRVGIAILICLAGLGGWMGAWLLFERSLKRHADSSAIEGLRLRTTGGLLWIASFGGGLGVGASVLIASKGRLSVLGCSPVSLGVIGVVAGAICSIQARKQLTPEAHQQDMKARLRLGGVIALTCSLVGTLCVVAFFLATKGAFIGAGLLMMGAAVIALLVSLVLIKWSKKL